jgi:hypothetical protein
MLLGIAVVAGLVLLGLGDGGDPSEANFNRGGHRRPAPSPAHPANLDGGGTATKIARPIGN